MKNILKKGMILILTIMFCFCFSSCKKNKTEIILPENISLTENESEVELKVYDINLKSIINMKLEEYVQGVLAGEMFNNWPLEALKAQAVLARTYTLYFLQNLTSKYDGADISNDITEAQAYDSSKINENIKQAVAETKGLVAVCDDELIEAWFHSNSGGKTTKASFGLNYLGEEKYTQIKDSPETETNSQNYKWVQTFTKSDILSALRTMGVNVTTISSFEIGQSDDSGRALTFNVGGTEFSASTFRLKIGSTKFKSTLITNITVSKTGVMFTGYGYGHGVGMSQWGAKIMAEEGKNYKDIIEYYFDNVEIKESKYVIE